MANDSGYDEFDFDDDDDDDVIDEPETRGKKARKVAAAEDVPPTVAESIMYLAMAIDRLVDAAFPSAKTEEIEKAAHELRKGEEPAKEESKEEAKEPKEELKEKIKNSGAYGKK